MWVFYTQKNAKDWILSTAASDRTDNNTDFNVETQRHHAF